jgi:3-phosphoshikimate 1-carboxyvinyltransferase
MANLKIKPLSKIKSEIHVPGDKSISHRAIMIGALANGETVVNGFLPSADCLATVACFRKLGISIKVDKDKVVIQGKGLNGLKQPKGTLNVGNSGTTIRLLSGILAGQSFPATITGDESIQKRPMMRIVNPLREMGAEIEGQGANGNIFAPLRISGGNLAPIRYDLPVASAQVKSAVLLAGLFADGVTTVVEKHQARDHTERMLDYFGARIKLRGLNTQIQGKNEFDGAEIDIPGDLSSAAFFIVAGLLVPDSELLVRNVGVNPTRIGIIEVLHRMGAKLEVKDEEIISEEPRANMVISSSGLSSTVVSGEIIPKIIDEIPIIAVAATQAQGKTEIRGAKELRVKESDRIATISAELKKMGANIKELDDGMIIEGPTKLRGAAVKSYGDHRVAMAMAIAGLIAEGETTIEDTTCIETSFPGFEKILKKISK